MKKNRLKVSDIISRTEALDEQIAKIKGRLDSLSFHKHKHRNRLKMLAKNAEQLEQRLEAMEHQLPSLLSLGGKGMAKRWKKLHKQYKLLRKSPPKLPRSKPPVKLKRVKKKLTLLSNRQQGMQSRVEDILAQLSRAEEAGTALERETVQLKQQLVSLEDRNQHLAEASAKQESRILDTETQLAELSSGEREKTWRKSLEAEADGLQQGLEALKASIEEGLSERQRADQQLQAMEQRIEGLEKAPVAEESEQSEPITREEGESYATRLEVLEAESSRLDGLINGLTDGAVDDEVEKRLGWVESQVVRLTEGAETLQEGIRELGSHELDTNARLESLKTTLEEYTRDNSSLKNGVHSLSGEIGQADAEFSNRLDDLEKRLESVAEITGSITARMDGLDQSRELPIKEDDKLESLSREITGHLDRVEEAAIADRERIDQLNADLSRVQEQGESQRQFNEEGNRQLKELEAQVGRLADELENQLGQLASMSDSLRDLPNRADDSGLEHESLSARVDALEEIREQNNQRLKSIDNNFHGVLSQLGEFQPNTEARLSELQTGLNQVVGTRSNLEQRVEEAVSTGKTNRLALLGLVLLGILAGAALYHFGNQKTATNTARLAELAQSQRESEQGMQQLVQRFGDVERQFSSDSGNQLIGEIPPLSSPGVDETRIEVIEARLSELANRPGSDQSSTLSVMDGKLAGLESRLRELESTTTAIENNAGSESLDSLRTTIATLDEQQLRLETLETRFTALETSATTPEAAIAENQLDALRASVATIAQQTAKLNDLETRITSIESATAAPEDKALDHRLATLQSSVAGLDERMAQVEDLKTRFAALETRAAAPEAAAVESELDSLRASVAAITQQTAKLDDLETRIASIESATAAPEDQALDDRLATLQSSVAGLDERMAQVESLETRITSIESTDFEAAGASATQQISALNATLGDLDSRLAQLELEQQSDKSRHDQLLQSLASLTESSANSAAASESIPTWGSPIDWEKAQQRNAYSIQLVGAHNKALLQRFHDSHNGADGLAFFQTTFNGRDWYILLYGAFDTVSAASKTLRTLPDSLRRYNPWIRRVPDNAVHLP